MTTRIDRAVEPLAGHPGVYPHRGELFMGREAAAKYLGMSPSTLDRHRKRHPMWLAGYRIYANQVLYRKADLDSFREEYLTPRPVEPTEPTETEPIAS